METMHEEKMDGMSRFEAMMQEEAFRFEVEGYVARAVEKARGSWMIESERRVRSAREEGEMLARMDADAQLDARFAEREAQLNQREMQIQAQELRNGALRQLHQRGLPEELQDAISYDSQERVQQSLDAVEQAFRSAVQRGIEQRLRGEIPSMARIPADADASDAEYYGAHYAP